MMPKMRVGVAVPTYNRPKTLARALRSLARQTRVPDLVVVVNDYGASTDATESLFPELPLRSIQHATNQGNAAARNSAIAELQGFDLIVFLDDDDELDPNYLAEAVAEFARQPALAFGWAAHRIWIDDGATSRLAGSSAWQGPSQSGPLGWLRERRAGASGLVLRPSVFDRVGMFDASLRSAVDTDWLVRAADERSGLLPGCWLEVHREPNHTGVSSSYASRFRTYATLLEKHKAVLAGAPQFYASFLARTARLALAAGEPVTARRLLLASLRVRIDAKSTMSLGLTFMPFASQAYRAGVAARTKMK